MIESSLIAGTQSLGATSLLLAGSTGAGTADAAGVGAGAGMGAGTQVGDGFRERFEASAGLAPQSTRGVATGTFAASGGVADGGGVGMGLMPWRAAGRAELTSARAGDGLGRRGLAGGISDPVVAVGDAAEAGVEGAGSGLGSGPGAAAAMGGGSGEAAVSAAAVRSTATPALPLDEAEVAGAPGGAGAVGRGGVLADAAGVDARSSVGTEGGSTAPTLAADEEGRIGTGTVPTALRAWGYPKASGGAEGVRAMAASLAPAPDAPAAEKAGAGPGGWSKRRDVAAARTAGGNGAGTNGVAAAGMARDEGAGGAVAALPGFAATSQLSLVAAGAAGAGAIQATAAKASGTETGTLDPVGLGTSAGVAGLSVSAAVAGVQAAAGKAAGASLAAQGASAAPHGPGTKKKVEAETASASVADGLGSATAVAAATVPLTVPAGLTGAVPVSAAVAGAAVAAVSGATSRAVAVRAAGAGAGTGRRFVAAAPTDGAAPAPTNGAAPEQFASIGAAMAAAGPQPAGLVAAADATPQAQVRPVRVERSGAAGKPGVGNAVPAGATEPVDGADGAGAVESGKSGAVSLPAGASDLTASVNVAQAAMGTGPASQAPVDTRRTGGAAKAGAETRVSSPSGVTAGVTAGTSAVGGAAGVTAASPAAGEKGSAGAGSKGAGVPVSEVRAGAAHAGVEMQVGGVAGPAAAQGMAGGAGEMKAKDAGPQGLGTGAGGAGMAGLASGGNGLEPTTLVATPNVLEVGVASGTNGWLKVRAEMDGTGGVAASVTATTASAADALHKELPALSAYLRDESVGVSSLVVSRGEASAMTQDATANLGAGGFGTGSQAGRGGQAQAGEAAVQPESRAEAMEPKLRSVASEAVSTNALAAGYGPASGGWLNVVA